jgi:anti-sigma B factor antagonist
VSTLSASIAVGESGPLITLSGEIDITNLAELSEVLTDPRVNGTAHLTIDASGLSSADSMAARALALTAKILKERGGGMVLLRPHQAIVRILKLTGADRMMTIRLGSGTTAEPRTSLARWGMLDTKAGSAIARYPGQGTGPPGPASSPGLAGWTGARIRARLVASRLSSQPSDSGEGPG